MGRPWGFIRKCLRRNKFGYCIRIVLYSTATIVKFNDRQSLKKYNEFTAKVAERVGFEPTVELTPYNGFRVMNNRIVRTHTEPLPLNAYTDSSRC